MIAVEEVPSTNGSHSGYFDSYYFKGNWTHSRENGAGRWMDVDVKNYWGSDTAAWIQELYRMTSDGFLIEDTAYSWKNGHIEWEILYGWNTNGTTGVSEPSKIFEFNAVQRFEIKNNGDFSVQKLGNIVMRTTNNWYYLNGVRKR